MSIEEYNPYFKVSYEPRYSTEHDERCECPGCLPLDGEQDALVPEKKEAILDCIAGVYLSCPECWNIVVNQDCAAMITEQDTIVFCQSCREDFPVPKHIWSVRS